ncbi:hypothetical protein Ahy_B08g092379 [Arachis hypogaea]|uniref:Uncharacterized protein n=1 Tax=Arachis hypogaea TaxID=3818 RepID=A0A444Y3T1_ARAHY|nr:hypothetical protein Ahy_B08g092379 [Arachis hypogaea]
MLFADMTIGRGITDQSRGYGRGRGRISTGTFGTSRSSPYTMTTLVTSQECTNVIKLMYDHPWLSYKKIPTETKERWFQKWGIFDYRMARRLPQMMEDIRKRRDQLTIWLRSNLKKVLYVYWETDEGFKHRCLMNRANRASARSSKYTGGSATFIKTKARLSKSLSRDATMVETFKYTHTLKDNKERFANQRFANHYTGDDGNNSAASEVDPHTVWRKTASDPYKNHVYGLGLFFTNNLCISTLIPSSTSTTSRTVNSEDNVDLREQVGVEAEDGAVSTDGTTDGGVPRSDTGQWQRHYYRGTNITAQSTASAKLG